MNKVFGHISPTPYAIVVLSLQILKPVSLDTVLEMEVRASTGTEGRALQLPLEKMQVFLKWESHQGFEPSHLESLGGKLWGQEGSSVETERTQQSNVRLAAWWEGAA